MTAMRGGDGAALAVRPPASRSATSLAEQARSLLAQARTAASAAERFRLAHLAALRTAAAVFAERSRPGLGRRRLVSAWVLVESVAPELAAWAAYFADTAGKRAAVEAGAVSVVTNRDAEDQLRAAEQFLVLAEQSLGFIATPLAS
jgi:predicted ATP-grasp superfamily ATP-dependent carboligase